MFDILLSAGTNNPSWIIRHCALIGLSRVAQICKNQTAKDGFSSVAWSKLVERQSVETDQRVLEAHKLQQVDKINFTVFYNYAILDRHLQMMRI